MFSKVNTIFTEAYESCAAVEAEACLHNRYEGSHKCQGSYVPLNEVQQHLNSLLGCFTFKRGSFEDQEGDTVEHQIESPVVFGDVPVLFEKLIAAAGRWVDFGAAGVV